MASEHETIFTMEATPIKFGTGASGDAGWELKLLGVKRPMLVTAPPPPAGSNDLERPRLHR